MGSVTLAEQAQRLIYAILGQCHVACLGYECLAVVQYPAEEISDGWCRLALVTR